MTETENTSRRPGALIAMSGGVDSSVAAWLMQRDGFDLSLIHISRTRGYSPLVTPKRKSKWKNASRFA